MDYIYKHKIKYWIKGIETIYKIFLCTILYYKLYVYLRITMSTYLFINVFNSVVAYTMHTEVWILLGKTNEQVTKISLDQRT